MRTILLTGLLFLFSVNLLYGQNISMTGLEVENHEEVSLALEKLSQDALDIGLTARRIESKVNVRLRQVGLKPTTDRNEFLYVNINVQGGAFNILINFIRGVYFYRGEELYFKSARVYTTGITGTHGSEPEYIISVLDQALDQFLSDYLDAND